MVVPLPGIDLSPEALLRGRDGPAAATAAALSPPGQPTPRVQLFVSRVDHASLSFRRAHFVTRATESCSQSVPSTLSLGDGTVADRRDSGPLQL